MGQISQTLAARLNKGGPVASMLRDEAESTRRRGRCEPSAVGGGPRGGADPLHGAYIAIQNLASVFAESVSQFPELEPYGRTVDKAVDEYLTEIPGASPLTPSYFTTWAFLDVRFGPDQETIGTCMVNTGRCWGMDEHMTEVVRAFQTSRMGIYEHVGAYPHGCELEELVTGKRVRCHVPVNYFGSPGELWFVRVCPPLFNAASHSLIFTTPYILKGVTRDGWTEFLHSRTRGRRDQAKALHKLMKEGPNPYFWPEFVLQGYHHHLHDAIFLSGRPDRPSTLPHPSQGLA